MEQPVSVNGFVVLHEDGKKSLSRSGRWVHHRNRVRGLPGTRRTWVHTHESIKNGTLPAEVGSLLPACFDPVIEYTTITGGPIAYSEFLNAI